MAKENKAKALLAEFKAFISRGNVLDMAVGVIVGGAFNAIVTAVTGILLSLCTWAVPGGLKGLVIVLPALSEAQKGMDPSLVIGKRADGSEIALAQKFFASELQDLAKAEAIKIYGDSTVTATPTLIENVKTTILGKYTIHGTQYTYNLSTVLDWGTLINAIISFLIIALTLFIVVKVATTFNKKRLEMEAKAKATLANKEEPAAE